jgi:hypothetical protein
MISSAGSLQAQDQQQKGRGNRGGGNFDPSEFQARMMEGVRNRLDVKDDTEWKAIEPLVKKVMDARREQLGSSMRGAFGRGGGPGGGGGGGNGDNNGGGNRTRGGFGGEPSAEEEALSKAVEAKASKDELKTKMTAFRKAKEANEKKLHDAQDELKKVLSVQQEAAALQMGLVR